MKKVVSIVLTEKQLTEAIWEYVSNREILDNDMIPSIGVNVKYRNGSVDALVTNALVFWEEPMCVTP